MDSQTLEKEFGFEPGCWRPWASLELRTAPNSKGVYVFRAKETFGRRNGLSDILYVGSGNIRDRLRAHADPDWDSLKDAGWRILVASAGQPMEVGWQQIAIDKVRSVEAHIRERYLMDHCELPPASVSPFDPLKGTV